MAIRFIGQMNSGKKLNWSVNYLPVLIWPKTIFCRRNLWSMELFTDIHLAEELWVDENLLPVIL